MRSVAPAPRPLPGVRAVLDHYRDRDDTVLALLTGNYGPSARLKLEPLGLWDYFQCGAFGDDAPDRNGLVPIAIARAQACGHASVDTRWAVVIGDTPHDVRCAAAHGVRSLGVATGGCAIDVLRDAGADAVLPDLSDTPRVVAILDALSR
jgi:phosphoglycolate phosphatase-like HAD superfamily hydrolase